MGQFADDTATDIMLGEQGVLPIQLIALGNVEQFHEYRIPQAFPGKAHAGRQNKIEISLRRRQADGPPETPAFGTGPVAEFENCCGTGND